MSQQSGNNQTPGGNADREISNATVALLAKLDHAALSSCLYAACDLALKAARGKVPLPDENMTADQLVRQIVNAMPPRPATVAEPTTKQ